MVLALQTIREVADAPVTPTPLRFPEFAKLPDTGVSRRTVQFRHKLSNFNAAPVCGKPKTGTNSTAILRMVPGCAFGHFTVNYRKLLWYCYSNLRKSKNSGACGAPTWTAQLRQGICCCTKWSHLSPSLALSVALLQPCNADRSSALVSLGRQLLTRQGQ